MHVYPIVSTNRELEKSDFSFLLSDGAADWKVDFHI